MHLSYRNTCSVPRQHLLTLTRRLSPYVRRLQRIVDVGGYDAAESSLNLLDDRTMLRRVERMVRKTAARRVKTMMIVGIGGSSLGSQAFYDALYGYRDGLELERRPKLMFLDTCDPEFLGSVVRWSRQYIRRAQDILINVVSKSGSTTETIANFEVLYSALHRLPGIRDRIVVTTDDGSPLHRRATQLGLSTLRIPALVGGRYSVFSPVGLLPLAVADISLPETRRAARRMRDQCLSENISVNPALLSAAILFGQWKRGYTIHDTFLFHRELETLGKWYRQLLAESLGKEFDARGRRVHAGITPTVSIGSTDLHSMGQLYLAGPMDKMTTFVTSRGYRDTPQIAQKPLLKGLVDGIEGKSLEEIMEAIAVGTMRAYARRHLPFMHVTLDSVTAPEIAAFMQWKMLEIMYLGKLMHVNAFDQPNVEEYKKETRRILRYT